MEKNTYKSDIIEGMFNSIIPEGLIGEQYTKDVALIFKPEDILISTKTKYQKVDIVKTDYYNEKIHRSAFDLPEFMKRRIQEEI